MNFRFLNIILLFFVFTISNCQNLENKDYFEKIGQLKLNYSIRGKGPVMIIGHLYSGKIGYQLTLKSLENRFTMVYYEPRGTGKSESPKTLQEYDPNYIVDEIDNLRKHLNVDKIWLFGHSDQSAIALDYALKFPNHIEGLILSGTSLVGTQQESIERRKISEQDRSNESIWFSQVIQNWDFMIKNKTEKNNLGEDISNSPIKWWCYDENSSQKVIPIVNEISKQGRRKSIDGKYWIESEENRNQYLKSQNEFHNIKAKILIINGKYDTNNPPKYAELLHEKLPNSKLVLIEKAGHFPWIENPEPTFQEIENWLNLNL